MNTASQPVSVSGKAQYQVLCKVDYSPFPLRFVTKVLFKSDGCWIWQGSTGFHPKYRVHRYGQITIWTPGLPRDKAKKRTTAHRFAYECVHGALLPALDVDHLCGVKLCVNPAHLEAVTHRENIIRSYQRRKP